MAIPQWATPVRQQHLAKLFVAHSNKCKKGHFGCPHFGHWFPRCAEGEEDCPNVRHYLPFLAEMVLEGAPSQRPVTYYRKISDAAIDSWKAEDREERSALRKREEQQLRDGTHGRFGSDFDPVARDVYYQERPGYYFLGFGINLVTMKRVAVIRVPSTYIHLHVSVSEAFQDASLSKNQKRKMKRYGLMPWEVWERVDTLCGQAVRSYWAS